MTRAAVFGRNDLRGITREPFFAFLIIAPLVWIAMVRFGTPPVSRMVSAQYGLDLAPYHPLILTAFLLLTCPIVVGAMGALLVLDERDAGTLTALRVTPTPLRSYLGYRAATVAAITAVYIVATMPASGLLPMDRVLPLVPVGLLGGLSGIVIALIVLALARNKVEGIGVVRGLGIIVAGLPLIPYFLGPAWQYPFWLLPPYWPAKAYWLLAEGAAWWPYVLGGALYHVPLIWLLYRGFRRTVR